MQRRPSVATAFKPRPMIRPLATTTQIALAESAPGFDRAHVDAVAQNSAQLGGEQVLGAPPDAMPIAMPAPPMSITPAAHRSRWSVSAWLATRRGAPASGAMLGGDQAGLRLGYMLDARRNLALYARATAPLAEPGRELALGIEWQPTALPVRLVAEHRSGIDGNRGGPTLAVVGGTGDVALPLDLKLEAYAQAGGVARGRIDPFADGALRITREVAVTGRTRLHVGGGAWGAAQRGASRLDMGPTAVVTLPLGTRAMRVAVDWRERIAGDAQPGSGPALTLGTDF